MELLQVHEYSSDVCRGFAYSLCIFYNVLQLERLQMLLDQEKQASKDVEQLGDELRKDKQRLQKTLETLQADRERQVHEHGHL